MKKKLSVGERILKKSKEHKLHTTKHVIILTIVIVSMLVVGKTFKIPHSISVSPSRDNNLVLTHFGNINTVDNGPTDYMNKLMMPLKRVTQKSDYISANFNLGNNANDNIKNIEAIHMQEINSLSLSNKQHMSFDKTKQIFNSVNKKYPDLLSGDGTNIINNDVTTNIYKGKKIATVTFSDTKSKFINNTENNTSISLNPKIFIPIVKKLEESNDIVVVRVNWGVPNERTVSERQRQYAHALADAGADIIIGNNNVIQKIEEYKKTQIYYSLGNLSSKEFLSKNNESIIVQQEFIGKEMSIRIIPVNFKSGYISKNIKNKIKEQQILNYIKDPSMKWKTKEGDFIYEK
ncbi:CapA family protein [Mammaliicoccus sciuri]|uniref:CapA family protein n=1 Tax=Mammaliicoccus sciuri TaxID=1296 RepID=UPI001E383B35|nr:CapA family protein [Mammaliicoccus sciuri]MCD8898492.1 CapA family protein [Mammaliicoccus sciuri]